MLTHLAKQYRKAVYYTFAVLSTALCTILPFYNNVVPQLSQRIPHLRCGNCGISCGRSFLPLINKCSAIFAGVPVCAYQDAPEAWQMGFQDPATPIMQGIIDLHHDICFFLLVILVFVIWVLARTLYHFSEIRHPQPEKILHGSTIEIAWTILPCLILVLIAVPSFALLYSMDEVVNPAVTVKAIGHQWYWSYEYSDYNESDEQTLAFDSYMIPEDDLQVGQLRLLEVDNRVVLPVNTHIRVIITSADVLHSWAIPSLGVKCDAVPGRLNQTPLFIKREGVFYGQCSELCGANHGFMPIVVESVSLQDYISWVSNKIQEG